MTTRASGEIPPADGPQIWVAKVGDAGKRLDVVVAGKLAEVSRTQVTRNICEGHVEVDGQVVTTPSRKVRAGERIRWAPPPPVPVTMRAQDIPLDVVYEDAWLLVLDKPPGLVVHPAPGHEDGTLVNALLAHVRDLRGIGGELRPGIVHRLDRDTSGLMVVAKDEPTLNALGADFRVHRILRRYEALVAPPPGPESGRIETQHGRDPHNRKKFSIKVKTGKKAVTGWRVLERVAGAARIEAELFTGRTHQVRVHFSAMGSPILGDPVYGRPPRDAGLRELAGRLARQALHAKTLGFFHPQDGRWLEFESKPPADMLATLAALREMGARGNGAGGGRAGR